MIEVATTSPDETGELAACVAATVEPGDLILLVGELGAGKTAFSKAFGQALGVTEPMTSPTFTLAREYQGRLRLFHLDVYRLEHLSEAMDLDLPDLLDSEGVVLIEWGDALVPILPADFLEISLRFGVGDDDRTIELRAVGDRWVRREADLAERIETLGPGTTGDS